MKRLEGKVALVTGGSGGIGSATLRRFVEEGAAVVCADVNEEGGKKLVSELESIGGKAAFVRCDVSSLEEITSAVETPMLDAILGLGLKSREAIEEMHALGRNIRPEEVANLVLFLASDESSGITGQWIIVDGGLLSGCDLTGIPPVA